jgi:hypothetical protein
MGYVLYVYGRKRHLLLLWQECSGVESDDGDLGQYVCMVMEAWTYITACAWAHTPPVVVWLRVLVRPVPTYRWITDSQVAELGMRHCASLLRHCHAYTHCWAEGSVDRARLSTQQQTVEVARYGC